MPLLPIEAPAGVQFGYRSETDAIKLSTTRGLYTVDAVNGTVYFAEMVAGLDTMPASLAVTVAAEAANEIRVSVQVQDVGGNNLAAATKFRVDVLDADMTASTNATLASVETGTAISTLSSSKSMLATSSAAGLLEFDVLDVAAETVHLVIQVLGDGAASAHQALTFA